MLKAIEIKARGQKRFFQYGCFYKVIRIRHVKDKWWIFECKDIDKKDDVTFNFQILGMWELLDKASTMQDPKDILLIDLDQQGKWMIWTQDELEQRLRHEEEKRNRETIKRGKRARTHTKKRKERNCGM